MIKMRKKHPNRTLFLMFLLCLSLIIGLFAYRVGTGICVTKMSAGEPTMLSREYTLGTIVDRNGEFIVSGDQKAGGVMWKSPETMTAFKDLLGLNFEETMESRTSILINAPWVFGAEDNRFTLYSLLHPQNKRVGGDAKITIDRNLQEYISSYILKKGYNTDDVYAVVSDYRTGELLGVYGKAFLTLLSPGSTMKPVIAASVLDLDPDKKNFTYDCIEANHVFQTEDGAFKIDCSGVHGQMNMEDAMADSCNGYFISLLQSVDKKSLLEKMKCFGFDTEIAYPQFEYADQKFASGAASESDDYLMAAIGQASAKTTVLGMQLCTSALLNGGYLQSPYWINAKRATAQDKNWTDIEVNQEASRRVCNKETADFVVKAMEEVTEKGTGKNFNFPADSGYLFAAKTGTAQKGISSEETGEELYSVWTTGGLVSEDGSECAAPYAVTVCLDNVNDKEITSQQAGEMARDILLFLTEKCEQ